MRAWVKTMAAVAATALPDCLSAEGRTLLPRAWLSLLCPPRGRKERAMRAWVKTRAALAATALPDCLSAEGRTLLSSRWRSQDDNYYYRHAIIKI